MKFNSKCTHIPLRFENKEVKLGSATRSVNTALRKALATNWNTANNPQTEFSAKTTEKQEKKMQGHIVGTGVSVPSPLQAKCFGKAGEWWPQVDKWAKLEGDTAKGEGFLLLLSMQQFISLKPFLYCPFNGICPHRHWTKKAHWQGNKIIVICKQTNLYTGCSRWFTISLNCIISTTKIAKSFFRLLKPCYSSAPSVHNQRKIKEQKQKSLCSRLLNLKIISGDSDKNMETKQRMAFFLKRKAFFFSPKVVQKLRIVAALQLLLLPHCVLCLNFLYTMVSEAFLTSQDGTDIFPAVVFGAVAWGPVGCLEGWTGAVQGADHSTGLHCSLRVLIN